MPRQSSVFRLLTVIGILLLSSTELVGQGVGLEDRGIYFRIGEAF